VHRDLERVVLLAHSSKPFGDARMEILRAGRGHTANYLTLLQHIDGGAHRSQVEPEKISAYVLLAFYVSHQQLYRHARLPCRASM